MAVVCWLRNPEGIAIIQPKVARNELPWVIVQTNSSTLKELHQSSGSISEIEPQIRLGQARAKPVSGANLKIEPQTRVPLA
jgi:hypothetical protein